MKKNMQPILIAPSWTAAVNFAKHTLRYTDKTFRLKNTRITDVIPSKVPGKYMKLPSIIVEAETCFRANATIRVYISKEYSNIIPYHKYDK